MGSSLILERPGIGAASILRKFGIKQVVDLPGVGKEYDDHPFLIPPHIVDANTVTTEALSGKDPELWSKLLCQWDTDGSGRKVRSTLLTYICRYWGFPAAAWRRQLKCVLGKMNSRN
ncbi:hypothetical protein IW262DRAFT_1077239 [Armillaria fumosa]|nr:hypothetical protein IW262DRAFT_1077239 [Armillaria fumosa]